MQTLPTTLSLALTILDTHLFLIDEMLPHTRSTTWSIHPSGPLNTSAVCIFLNVVLFIFWRLERDHSDFFIFLYSCLISSVQSEAELQSSSAGGDQHQLVSQLLARLLQLGCERRLFHLGSNYLFSIFFIESQSKHFNELYIFIILA